MSRICCSLFILSLFGCGSDSTAQVQPDAGDPDTVRLAGMCSLEDDIGGFEASIFTEFSGVSGKVTDGVNPGSLRDIVASSDGCVLLRKTATFCDPACGPSFVCDQNGSCVPTPLGQDVGTVSVSGLEKSIEMEPLPPGNNYLDTQVPHPVFLQDASIVLKSTNGTYGELELFGVGGQALATPNGDWTIARDASLAIRWTAPSAPEPRTRIHAELTIDQHGNAPIALSCDLDDDGEHDVAASLINMLLDSGVSGFPNGSMTRQTADKITVSAGCIDFVVNQPIDRDVRVAGHTPCKKEEDCPEELTCDIPNETCI